MDTAEGLNRIGQSEALVSPVDGDINGSKGFLTFYESVSQKIHRFVCLQLSLLDLSDNFLSLLIELNFQLKIAFFCQQILLIFQIFDGSMQLLPQPIVLSLQHLILLNNFPKSVWVVRLSASPTHFGHQNSQMLKLHYRYGCLHEFFLIDFGFPSEAIDEVRMRNHICFLVCHVDDKLIEDTHCCLRSQR